MNNLLHLCTGYAIAKKLNRSLYIPYDRLRTDDWNVVRRLRATSAIFPKLQGLYTFLDQRSINQTLVPFAYQQNGLPSCCLYEDPLKFAANKEQFLLLDMKFGQNVNYFLDYLHDIREFLRFSASVRLQGERAFKQLKMDVASAMCVHVRRGDFLELNLAVNKTDIVRVTTKIANEQRLHQYLIFGDDVPFMKVIAKSLMRSGTMDGSPYVARASESTEGTDLYVSSRACAAFLISSPISTFGWWLAFFTINQQAVYYMNDRRPMREKVVNKELFLPPWREYVE